MTYRDLIVVLCFIALGAWCWAGPVSQPEPQETPLVKVAPKEIKKQPKLTPTEMMNEQDWVHPKLDIKVRGQAQTFDDLVLSVTLLPRTDNLTLEMSSATTPKAHVVFTADDKQWVFNSPLNPKAIPSRTVSKDKTLDWEIPISSLEPDRDIAELKALFRKKALTVSTEVFEAGQDNNPMSRRVYISILGATSIPTDR